MYQVNEDGFDKVRKKVVLYDALCVRRKLFLRACAFPVNYYAYQVAAGRKSPKDAAVLFLMIKKCRG